MAKFYGKIGYGIQTESKPGVWKEEIIERYHYGDLSSTSSQVDTTDKVNDDIKLTTKISITSNSFAKENLGAMKYVIFMGTKWKITKADPLYPRIHLTIGGVYNGK